MPIGEEYRYRFSYNEIHFLKLYFKTKQDGDCRLMCRVWGRLGSILYVIMLTGTHVTHIVNVNITVEEIKDVEIRVADTLPGLELSHSVCADRPGVPVSSPDTITCTTPIYGQYVKVHRYSTANNSFCVTEIQVFCG